MTTKQRAVHSQWLKKKHLFLRSGVNYSDSVSCCEWVLVCPCVFHPRTKVEGAVAASDKLCSSWEKGLRSISRLVRLTVPPNAHCHSRPHFSGQSKSQVNGLGKYTSLTEDTVGKSDYLLKIIQSTSTDKVNMSKILESNVYHKENKIREWAMLSVEQQDTLR